MLGLPLIGVLPESAKVLTCSNMGLPVIANQPDDVAIALEDTVARFLGEKRDMKFLHPPSRLVCI